MRRCVCYCPNAECVSAFELMVSMADVASPCARCGRYRDIEQESGSYDGEEQFFYEVMVEYNFTAEERRYREMAIVRDETRAGGNTYRLRSPLIKAEKRALKIAEAVLANLNQYSGSWKHDEVPRSTAFIIDLDAPRSEFDRRLTALSKLLGESEAKRG